MISSDHVHMIHDEVSFCKTFFFFLVNFLHNFIVSLAFSSFFIRFSLYSLANHLSILQKPAPVKIHRSLFCAICPY